MFGRKQKKTIEVTKLSSLIADNLQIVGDVLFSGGLRVDGKVEGNVLGKSGEKSLVVVSEQGCIIGRVHAYDAVVNGTISGDLEVEHFLELQPGAKVSGNISYSQLQMECGATVEGQLVRVIEGPVPEVKHGAEPETKREATQAFERSASPAPTPTGDVPIQPAAVRQGRSVSAPATPTSAQQSDPSAVLDTAAKATTGAR